LLNLKLGIRQHGSHSLDAKGDRRDGLNPQPAVNISLAGLINARSHPGNPEKGFCHARRHQVGFIRCRHGRQSVCSIDASLREHFLVKSNSQKGFASESWPERSERCWIIIDDRYIDPLETEIFCQPAANAAAANNDNFHRVSPSIITVLA
jgi:hypothetical protein